jgi:hypothetical protein
MPQARQTQMTDLLLEFQILVVKGCYPGNYCGDITLVPGDFRW